jgi:hypothetical protein
MSAAPAAAQDVTACLITKTDTNPFFVKMKEGAQAKAAELGVTLKTFAGKVDGDHDSQVAAIEACIADGAKGILIAASDTKAIVDQVKKAQAAGMVVIALDTPLDPADAADATFATGSLDAARMMVSMHRELAANGLSFADLSRAADEALPGFGDHARWQALARLETVYLAEIDALGFWDRQTARRVAVERGEVTFGGRIVLLATVDVDPLQRRLLAGVRGRIDALIPLPSDIGPEAEACFDDFGCLVPAAWQDRPLPLPLDRIAVVVRAEQRRLGLLMAREARPAAGDQFPLGEAPFR